MLLSFELSMPNVGSWNGKWSGEKDLHAKVINFSQKFGKSKNAEELAEKIIQGSPYYYNFGDGWRMSIEVKVIDSREAGKIRRKTRGFCGYDWAIDSILFKQKIVTN